jgi:hypothetical protein
LHRDERLMRKRTRTWASRNFLRWRREDQMANDVAVTYWMNKLQGIDAGKPLFVLETDREGPLLAATFIGRHRALSTRALLGAFVALPLVTAKIVAAIHWEALRLWLKGAQLVARPDTATANANGALANGKTRAYIS